MPDWLSRARYVLRECRGCSLVYQEYVGNEPLLNVVYDDWLNDTHLQFWNTAAYRHQVEHPHATRDGHEIFAVASALAKPLDQLRVLDYGIGWALWARIAAALGCTTFGYDLSANRRKYASDHGIKVVALDEISGLDLDFINVDQVFEHLTEPFDVLSTLAQGLRVGGVLKISVPNGGDIHRRLKRMNWSARRYSRQSLVPVFPLEHVNCFTSRAIVTMGARKALLPMSIPLRSYFAFAKQRRSVNLRHPMVLVKSILRPMYNSYSRNIIYTWLRRGNAA